MIKALSASLSLRMLGIFVVTATLVILILVSLFSRGLSGQWSRSIRPHLAQYIAYIQDDLGSPPDPQRADALARRVPVDIHLYHHDTLLHATTKRPLERDAIEFKPMAGHRRDHHRPPREARTEAAQKTPWPPPPGSLSHASWTPAGDPQRILRLQDGDYTIYFDLRNSRLRGPVFGRFNDELLLALLLLSMVLAASYLLIRQQLSPIRQIKQGVGIMSEGRLHHRINRKGNSDLDALARSIDAMAGRLQAILDAKRQLLVAISHELRSPITRARINTELLPTSRQRERLLEDLADMERMIHDIMESEQLQSNHSVLNREWLDVAELFAQELQRIAPDTPLARSTPERQATLHGDAARLRILLRNLVLNAQRHGRNEDGSVTLRVALSVHTDRLELNVTDEGPGIDAEHLDALATPFYRPDPSRSRETGGFGLGLTLARLIAEAHGGKLQIDSEPKRRPGTRILVTLARQGPSGPSI